MRAVKRSHGRAVTKRWFLKKASIVSFTLPATIRLDAVTDQNGTKGVSNTANLDLGPSLGSRVIPLAGTLHANINFNDAFDGGNLGTVKLSLPADGAALSTTSVPLLTNTNTTDPNTPAPESQLSGFVAVGGGSMVLNVGGGGAANDTAPVTVDATCASAPATPTGADLAACLDFAHAVRDAIGAVPNVGGSRNVYVAAVPGATKSATFLSGTIFVNVAFVGQKRGLAIGNQNIVTTAGNTASFPSLALLGVSANPFRAVAARTGTLDPDGMQGCGSYHGNGFQNGNQDIAVPAGQDVDLPSNLSTATKPGVNNNLGPGPYSPDPLAVPGDVVLRTGPLSLSVASTGTAFRPGDNSSDVDPGGQDALQGAALVSATSISVFDATRFQAGESITITNGTTSDLVTIGTVDRTTNTLNGLSPALANPYAIGALVTPNANGVVSEAIGPSGGRANLFGFPVNGLTRGNSVDVTVNLQTDINSIAREIDSGAEPFGGPAATTTLTANNLGSNLLTVTNTAGFAPAQIIAVGGDGVNTTATQKKTISSVSGSNLIVLSSALTGIHGAGTYISYTPEINGNISAYFNCRQAWTGKVKNYLTAIHLVGALRISPALTADGHVRIAKVALRTQAPAKESLAACLTPYQLYMSGNPLMGDPQTAVGPQLIFGAEFNPINILTGASIGASTKPGADCNSPGGPLDRHPFNVTPTGGIGLQSLLNNGAAVGVSGDITTNIKAEVLVGSFTN